MWIAHPPVVARALGVSLLAAALVLPAASAEARVKTVYAGPPGPLAGAPRGLELNGFYRRTVTINEGDTVRWRFRGFHTTTFVPRGQRPPPFVIADPANPTSGVRDAVGNPFWFNGQPSLLINPRVGVRVGSSSTDGRSYRNSGLPADRPRDYRLKFTRAGNHRYLCIVHPGMEGTVRVLGRGRATPSARRDTGAARAEAASATRSSRRLNAYRPAGNRVVAGHDRRDVALLKFFPAVKSIALGESVEFSVSSRSEIHNVSFGPPAYRAQAARDIVMPRPPAAPGGAPRLVLNPLVFLPSDPPPGLPPYDGANHGNGFLSTWALDTDPSSPAPDRQTVRFNRRGSFQFECLIHPGMRGTVNVR